MSLLVKEWNDWIEDLAKQGTGRMPLKVCNVCGSSYTHLPQRAQLVGGLYWFNCRCDSTLAVEPQDVD